MEVSDLSDNNPIEYTGNVLDHRNTLTGPDDAGKTSHPKTPKNVSITDEKRKNP